MSGKRKGGGEREEEKEEGKEGETEGQRVGGRKEGQKGGRKGKIFQSILGCIPHYSGQKSDIQLLKVYI